MESTKTVHILDSDVWIELIERYPKVCASVLEHAQMGTLKIGVHDVNRTEVGSNAPRIEVLRGAWQKSASGLQKVVSLLENDKRSIEPFRVKSIFGREPATFPRTWHEASLLIKAIAGAIDTIDHDSLRKEVIEFMASKDALPIPSSPKAREAALEAGLTNRRPFRSGKNSASDALLLFSVVSWAKKRSKTHVIFHTYNYKDFSVGKDSKSTPHPDLRDLFEPNTNVKLQLGLGGLEQYEGIDPLDLVPRSPFGCDVCDERVALEYASCVACGDEVPWLSGFEDYSLTSRKSGYLIDVVDERGDSSRVECESCSRKTFDIQLEAMCSYHGNRW